MELKLNDPTPSAVALFNEYVQLTDTDCISRKDGRAFRLGSGLSRHLKHAYPKVYPVIAPALKQRLKERWERRRNSTNYQPLYKKGPKKPKINYCYSCGFYFGTEGAGDKWRYCPGCQAELIK